MAVCLLLALTALKKKGGGGGIPSRSSSADHHQLSIPRLVLTPLPCLATNHPNDPTHCYTSPPLFSEARSPKEEREELQHQFSVPLTGIKDKLCSFTGEARGGGGGGGGGAAGGKKGGGSRVQCPFLFPAAADAAAAAEGKEEEEEGHGIRVGVAPT